jgi:hypothetical protein
MENTFFITLWKRKTWLLIAMIISIAVSFAMTAFLPKTFQVKNSLRLGQFMGKPIELSEFTQQRLKQVGFLSDAFEQAHIQLDATRDDYPGMVRVSIENDFNKQRDIDTILFATLGPTPELAAKMNQAISDHLIAVHSEAFNAARSIRDREVLEWETSIEKARQQIRELESRMDQANQGETLDRMALFLQSAKLQEQRAILVQMIRLKQKAILESHNPIASFPTQVASKVRVPQKAYFPRLPLVLAVLLFLTCAIWLFLCWVEFNFRDLSAEPGSTQ